MLLGLGRTPTGRGGQPSPATISSALRALWVAFIIIGELGVFYWSLVGCRWPSVEIPQKMRNKVRPAHIVMIADPQIQHSAMLADGSRWRHPVRRVLFELNMRKNWHVTARLQPDAVIVLGDMLANGKAARTLRQYTQATQTFKSIFECDEEIPMYFIAGNNDVGLGSLATSKNSYFNASFGPVNHKFRIANHEFVAINAPGLVYEDYQRQAKHKSFDSWTPIENGTVSFVKEAAEGLSGRVILLSHIPLARPEAADCGPLREKGTIRKTVGYGYQSMIGKQATSFLLRNLKPMVVYSADNRDYCDYVHVVPGTRDDSHNPENAVREVTVKSFSMSVHIRRPGFQLVTLIDPAHVATPASPSYADTPCLLPDQYSIYTTFYLPCFVLTLIALVVMNLRKDPVKSLRKQRSFRSPRSDNETPLPLVNGESAPWSATWPPFSPATPSSPRLNLPSHLRTPRLSSNSATHLVASLPGSPAPSSPATYLSPIPHDEEEDDTLFPAQYAIRRESDEWAHIGNSPVRDEDFEVVFDQENAGPPSSSSRPLSRFISAPSRPKVSAPPKRPRWSWSYSFVLRGRRRRIALTLPSIAAVNNLLDLVGISTDGPLGAGRRHRGSTTGMIVDVISVFWPATIAWIVINWSVL